VNVTLSTANSLAYPQGGHLWVFINWALAFRACGCNVVWLDVVPGDSSLREITDSYKSLCEALRPFGLCDVIALDVLGEEETTAHLKKAGLPTLDERDSFDVLIDLRYNLPRRLIRRYRHSAMIDLDPGQLQLAISQGKYPLPIHDVLFTIGESLPVFDAVRREWLHTFPCVALDQWGVVGGSPRGPWTTVSHWWGEWMVDTEGNAFPNAKRDGFQPYLDLPSEVPVRFELALCLGNDDGERAAIEAHGMHVVDAHEAAGTPLQYREYIQHSAGEFSCAKPGYVRLETGWLSDRTVCYLASGKPCVVQWTGPSRALPDGCGLHRFRDVRDAVDRMKRVIADYPSQCRAARQVAETLFDGRAIAERVLSFVS
jgi:hypothetical protein